MNEQTKEALNKMADNAKEQAALYASIKNQVVKQQTAEQRMSERCTELSALLVPQRTEAGRLSTSCEWGVIRTLEVENFAYCNDLDCHALVVVPAWPNRRKK